MAAADEEVIKKAVDAELLIPATEVDKALVVVNEALKISKPIAKKIGDTYAFYQQIINDIAKPSDIEENKNYIKKTAQKKIVENTEDEINKSKTPEELNNAIKNGEQKLEELNNQPGGQSGGKKIVSRTNKSIAQFLNSKVTFQSILKRMTSKYKKRKHSFTRRAKRML
jgi:hypothetical protein